MKTLVIDLTLKNGSVVKVDCRDPDGLLARELRLHGLDHVQIVAEERVEHREVLCSKGVL